MANGKFAQARQELVRAAKFNGKTITPLVEKKISALEQKIRLDKSKQRIELEQQQIDGDDTTLKSSYRMIFCNRTLLRDTVILSYIALLGHMFYYVLTINFAYIKNLSIEANFITSGAGEWVSVVVGAILLKLLTRKTCLTLFLLILGTSFAFQSIIDLNLVPSLDTPLIITANNGIGTLTALLSIFVVLIVNQEVYPTVIRQTGTSLTNTLGEFGSTLAPLLIQFTRLAGPWRANAIYTIVCAIGAISAQFVSKTDDIELPDT